MSFIGVDVSKDSLEAGARDGQTRSFNNSPCGVAKLLAGVEPGDTVAMEATGEYHTLLADTAHSMGLRVFVCNPKDVLYHARSMNPRAKTDRADARAIASYAHAKEEKLTAYHPCPEDAKQLRKLVRMRCGLSKSRVALRNQMGTHPANAAALRPAIEGISHSMKEIDRQIGGVARTLPQYALLDAIPGFGLVTSAYILSILADKTFRSSDRFVAFLGMDLVVKESGKYRGRRRLSKRGDPEARRLLYLAGQAACRRDGPFEVMYRRHLDRKLPKTAATVAVARKLARVAWSIYTKGREYAPDRVLRQPEPPSGRMRSVLQETMSEDPRRTALRKKLEIVLRSTQPDPDVARSGAQDILRRIAATSRAITSTSQSQRKGARLDNAT